MSLINPNILHNTNTVITSGILLENSQVYIHKTIIADDKNKIIKHLHKDAFDPYINTDYFVLGVELLIIISALMLICHQYDWMGFPNNWLINPVRQK